MSEGNELAGDINFNEMLSDAYQVINAATGDLTLIKLSSNFMMWIQIHTFLKVRLAIAGFISSAWK